jgi:8-oxo-dGTP diphosphatase
MLVTVDTVLLYEDQVLAIRRARPPFAGQWALPGGKLEPGEQTLHAAARELEEETGVAVSTGELRLLGVYDQPGRDPRGPTVTVTYGADLHFQPSASAGSDAAVATWIPIHSDFRQNWAFDHARMIADAWAQLRACTHCGRPGKVTAWPGPGASHSLWVCSVECHRWLKRHWEVCGV